MSAKKFFSELNKFLREIRAELRQSDWYAGMPDFILSFLLFATIGAQIFLLPFADAISNYFQYWFAWEVLAIFTAPSLIWIFEKRGPEDPRPIDVPRPWRIGICLFFLLLWGAVLGFKSFLLIIFFASQFLLARSIHFLFGQPNYRVFIKAGRRLGFAVLFLVFGGIAYVLVAWVFNIQVLWFAKGYEGTMLGVLYFLFFGFVETLAWPIRRILDLDQADKDYA